MVLTNRTGLLRSIPAPSVTIPRMGLASGQPGRLIQRLAQYGVFYADMLAWEPMASGAVRTPATFLVDDAAAYMEVMRTAAFPATTGNYGESLQIATTPNNEGWTDADIMLVHFGTGIRPQPWDGFILPRVTSVTGFLTDQKQVPAAETVYLGVYGQLVYAEPIVAETFYQQSKGWRYSASRGPWAADPAMQARIPANTTVIIPVKTDGDSDFEVEGLTIASDGPCTVNVQVNSSKWFRQDMRSELFGGSTFELPPDPTGAWVFALPAPMLVRGADGILVTVSDLSGLANGFQMVFHGQKLFPHGGIRVVKMAAAATTQSLVRTA